jgi:hypothetical protein
LAVRHIVHFWQDRGIRPKLRRIMLCPAMLQFPKNRLMHGQMNSNAAISGFAPSAPVLLLGLLLLTSP